MVTNNKNKIYNNEKSVEEAKYQSTFMPIFSHAEIQIKKMIAKFFWELKPKSILILALNKYISEIEKKIPENVYNRQAYISGLKATTYRYVEKYYVKARIVFAGVLGMLIANQLSIGVKMPKIDNPKQLMAYMKENKIKYNLWSQGKAIVRVQSYPEQLRNYIGSFAKDTMVTSEPGKKPISLWQKAELDIRYENQMKMVNDLKDNGVDLCWISTHPDCSKRCEKWQGKLVSLTQHSKYSGFRVMQVDGHWVYSLPDIMAQKDKYGYNNNIICGFNCRHYLKEYKPNSHAPKQYDSEDIRKSREANNEIRAIERRIRFYKQEKLLYNVKGDKINARKSHNKVNILLRLYKDTCNKYGFATQKFRIEI